MVEGSLQVECPYCGKEFAEEAPAVGGKKLREPPECLPYTRENGRIFHGGEWSKLGSDFLPLLLWDKTIGILRIPRSGVDLRFKNSQCPNCEEYFDVYANYTNAGIREMDMHEMWGHLLGRKSGEVTPDDDVVAYEGETLTGKIFKWLSGLFENDWAAAFLMALGVYLVFLAPLLWRNAPNLFGRNWSAVATEDWMTLLLRAGGAVCLAVLLYLGYKYADFMHTETGFYELFKVTKRRGITFWKNFSLSRFVGVQSGKGLPAISQATVIAGIPSALLLLLTWVIWRIGPLTVDLGFELGFWLVLSFYIGLSMWLALSTALYILNGVARIPMNLSPFDHFRNGQILEKILAFSTTTILIIFFLVIFLMFCQVYDIAASTVGWLLQWAQWGLIFLFVALSFACSRIPLLYAIAYLVVSVALMATPLTGAALGRARLFVLGSFLSFLLYFHYTRSRSPIEEIRAKYKKFELKKCDERIRRVQLQLNEMEREEVEAPSHLREKVPLQQRLILCLIRHFQRFSRLQEKVHLQQQNALYYDELRNLLELRERVEREPTKVRSSHYRNIAKALSPMVTSIILPLAIELADVWIDMLGLNVP
jgi:hypothetical protein